MRTRIPVADRIAKHTLPKLHNGCVETDFAKCAPYPFITIYDERTGKKKVSVVHRIVWALKHGPIPKGMFICHTCDNQRCINIDHLFIGTPADNMSDKCRKGRHARGESHAVKVRVACRSKLTWDDVNEIRRLFDSGVSTAELGRIYNTSRTNMYMISRHKTWASLPGGS